MNLLAFDLATKTGWAYFDFKTKKIKSGVVDCSVTSFDSSDLRFIHFQRFLNTQFDKLLSYHIFYEAVIGNQIGGSKTDQMYSGFKTTLTCWALQNKYTYEGINVKTIKKFIAGKGNASKNEVIEAVVRKGFNPKDDNEADAIAILLYGLNSLSIER